MKSMTIPAIATHRTSRAGLTAMLLLAGGLVLPFSAWAQVNPYNAIGLQWTAGGDDGNQGQATVYEMRYGTSAPAAPDSLSILSWWNAATAVSSLPSPSPSLARTRRTSLG